MQNLPENSKNLQKITFNFRAIEENNLIFHNIGISMYNIFDWALKLPKLKFLDIDCMNRDYSKIS